MSEAVLVDAQFSIVHLLRPYANFEDDYQGQPAYRRIMLSEVVSGSGGAAYDEQAERAVPGYDPTLIRALSVPLGARVLIWLPKINPVRAGLMYRWTFSWRIRNIYDYRQNRKPYHLPKQAPGYADTSGPTPQPRLVIPAAEQTVIYTQPEPANLATPVAQHARIEDVSASSGHTLGGLPFLPGGATGTIQQGVLDPGSGLGVLFARPEFFWIHEVQAVGDELAIGLWREDPDPGGPTSEPNWDFTQPANIDATASIFLGKGSTVAPVSGPYPDLGVMVMVGTAP